jgi:hypothetical protein
VRRACWPTTGETATTTTKRSKKLIAQLIGFIAGIGKQWPKPTTINMDDRVVSTDALSGEFQTVVDADAAAKAAEVQRTNAITKANTLAQGALLDANAFKAFLLATFGKNAATLADFELKPRRPTKVPVATKTEAANKAKATRQALGTMGARQKKQAKKALASPPAPKASAPEPTPPAPAAPSTSSKS